MARSLSTELQVRGMEGCFFLLFLIREQPSVQPEAAENPGMVQPAVEENADPTHTKLNAQINVVKNNLAAQGLGSDNKTDLIVVD